MLKNSSRALENKLVEWDEVIDIEEMLLILFIFQNKIGFVTVEREFKEWMVE